MDWTWYLFRFEGRINRAKMWLAVLIIPCWMIFIAGLVVATSVLFGGSTSFGFSLDDLFKAGDPDSYWSLSPASVPALIVKTVAICLFLWVYFATSIKRLHDRDRSGWWMVPFFAVPALFDYVADRLGESYAAMGLGLIVFVLGVWGFVELYCLKGTPRTNRFGADPLAPRDTRPGWQQQSELESVPHKAGPPPLRHGKRGA